MNKRTALIAVASVVILDLIATCLAVVNATPTVEFSMPLSSDPNPKKLRIESFASSPGIDLCSIWLQSTGLVNYTRFNYELASIPSSKPILNVPPAKTYTDIDVVDGTTDCNVVAMDSTSWYISGSSYKADVATNGTFDAIGVSNLESFNGYNVVLRKGFQISPFVINFKDGVETRRLSATSLLVASVINDTSHLFIGKIFGGSGTPVGDFPTTYPTSISIAVFDVNTWAVCAITDSFGCVFSNAPTVFTPVTTPFTPTMAAISFADCNNLAVVIATPSKYFLSLLDVNTQQLSNIGFDSASGSNTYGYVSIATTQKITSLLVSNSSGVFLDVFSWSFPSSCTEPLPPVTNTPSFVPVYTPSFVPVTTTPSFVPLSTPSNTPQKSPQSSPNAPQISPSSTPVNSPSSPAGNGTTNPGSQSPSSNVEGPKSDGSTPPSVDPVALGVGIAVPVAVLGAGAFLLVFLLRRRNKKKKQEKTIDNPVKDIDSPPPSVQSTDPGVYQNLPSNNTTNKSTYSSLGNVTNDSFTTASAAIELPEIDKRLHIPYKSLVFIKEIGAGSYGKVFLGEWRGAKVAIKVNNQITDVDGFLAEAKLTLGIAPHPNLVQTFGVSLDGPNPCIVLEYCGGGSLDLLLYDDNSKLDVTKQREFAMKIAYGLLHLHNNNIVHRDLAARNILLTNDQQPKISDFGMSRIIQEENSKGHTKTNFGPIRWMAPESLRDRSYSVKSDVWSYGIVVNEIISRKEPHVNEDQLSIAVKIRDQAATPEIPSNGDPTLVEVIHKCLKAEPKDRPAMEELCQFLRAKID